MAEHPATKNIPLDPALYGPRNEEVVDARNVHFRWAEVDGATEYRMQVAGDSSFEELLIDEAFTTETQFSAAEKFAAEDETFYWRVLALVDGLWSPGEHIESFLAGTPEQASLHLARPDDDGRLGPYPELIRSGAASAQAELTGSDTAALEEEEMGVEHEGIETGQIIGIAAAVIVALICMIIAVFFLYDNLHRSTYSSVVGMSGYPDRMRTEQAAAERLSGYGIIDEGSGIYKIPIERAMERMVEESVARPADSFSSELPLLPAGSRDAAAAPARFDQTPAATQPNQ